jgi:predicted DNA-binding protein YlxM (UPF0122 family)
MGRGNRRIADISEADLVRLYCDERLSLNEVAGRLGWSPSAIYSRLVALGIARRKAWARNAVEADAAELRRSYVDEGLSMSALAERYSCSLTTIWRKLQAIGVDSRPQVPKYPRRDFSDDPCEKAYLIGFRLGDLHVVMEGVRTIVVKCTSTRPEQIELFRDLFGKYGHVYTDEARQAHRRRQSIGMEVRLNLTFDFLLPKQNSVPDWILDNDQPFFAFLAGYLDAEGYVKTSLLRGYYTPQVRVEVRSYDNVLLDQLANGLNARGIACPPAGIRVGAGYVNRAGVRSNGVLWGFGVSRKGSLNLLFEKIDPYLRHPRRRRDMIRAWKVIASTAS